MVSVLGFAVALTVSFCLNLLLTYLYRESRKSPPPQTTYDARQLLHDLSAGAALIKVERVDPNDVFLRSPRGRRDD